MFNINLTARQAVVLHMLLGEFGGDPINSMRHEVDGILDELQNAVGTIDNPYSSASLINEVLTAVCMDTWTPFDERRYMHEMPDDVVEAVEELERRYAR